MIGDGVYESEDFRCPTTGYGVCLEWNGATGLLTAKIHDNGVWAKFDDATSEKAVRNKTFAWCEAFNLQNLMFSDLDEANRFAEQYDTWFP